MVNGSGDVSLDVCRALEEQYEGEKPSRRRPGHQNYPVDRRGVIFSGKTREPVVRGLTRPHSTRLYQDRLWMNNSGYGEFGVAKDSVFKPIVRLAGWTRGVTFHKKLPLSARLVCSRVFVSMRRV